MRPSLHEIALAVAERSNPGGQHVVTGIEIDGDPDDGPGDARVNIATRVPIEVQRVLMSVALTPDHPQH